MATRANRLSEERHADPGALSVPPGFRVDVAATGLDNPSSIEFDEEGNIFVAEMGSPLATAYRPGRVVRIRDDGSPGVVADGFEGSITGMVFYEGFFYVIEHAYSSRVYMLLEDGARKVLVDDLPGGGDNPTSDIVVAHSERIYFGQGTRTNAGIVGLDNPWLADHPELHDVPCRDVTLAGANYESKNPFGPGTMSTGAFKPFGTASRGGEIVRGSKKCSGGIFRMDPDGGGFEVFAWGLRRPIGMSVHPDGRIFCTDVGIENRGSRRISDGREFIWQVEAGQWYGWPDYSGGEPVTNPKLWPKEARQPQFVLRHHDPVSERPVAELAPGMGMGRFDFARSTMFGTSSTTFVPLMGDPGVVDDRNAYRVITANVVTRLVKDFITNKHAGPASAERSGGFERPVAVKFDRTGERMYILDMGITEKTEDGLPYTLPHTGVLWRVRTEEID